MVKSTTQNFFYQATSQVPYKSSATVPMDGDRAVGVERSGETVMRGGGGGGGGKNKRQAGQQPPNPFKAFMQAVFTSPTSPTSPTFTSAPNSAQLPTQILSIYGKPLTSLPVKYVLHKPDKLVLQPPAVVQLCTAYLLLFGVGTEGVFRVSGSSKRSSELEAVLSSLSSLEATAATGEDSESIVESWKDKFNVHDVAAVLKRIISRLPEPLCTSTHYEEFRGLNTGYPSLVKQQELLNRLPASNQHTLLHLLRFLQHFSTFSEHTLMTDSNLAKIFQPLILSHPKHSEIVETYHENASIVLGFIRNAHCLTPSLTAATPYNTCEMVEDIYGTRLEKEVGDVTALSEEHVPNVTHLQLHQMARRWCPTTTSATTTMTDQVIPTS